MTDRLQIDATPAAVVQADGQLVGSNPGSVRRRPRCPARWLHRAQPVWSRLETRPCDDSVVTADPRFMQSSTDRRRPAMIRV
jgi:hypothetical protein